MFLLDTHTFIWLATDRNQLPSRLVELISDESAGLFISAITAAEVGLLFRAGKINTYGACNDFLFKNLKWFGIHEIPVDAQIAFSSTQLPPIHRDPFDRIIVATAQKHDMTILTKDRIIPTYPKVKAVWE